MMPTELLSPGIFQMLAAGLVPLIAAGLWRNIYLLAIPIDFSIFLNSNTKAPTIPIKLLFL